MERPGWEVISWQVALFLPLSLITTFALWPPAIERIPLSAWSGLAYVSFISQFFAFFVFNAAMAMGGVARVGQLMLLQPFVIVALSLPVNVEQFDVSRLLYAAAVVLVVLVGQRMGVSRRRRGFANRGGKVEGHYCHCTPDFLMIGTHFSISALR